MSPGTRKMAPEKIPPTFTGQGPRMTDPINESSSDNYQEKNEKRGESTFTHERSDARYEQIGTYADKKPEVMRACGTRRETDAAHSDQDCADECGYRSYRADQNPVISVSLHSCYSCMRARGHLSSDLDSGCRRRLLAAIAREVVGYLPRTRRCDDMVREGPQQQEHDA